MSAVMNGSRHLDLDAALKEQEPLVFTFNGRDYRLPGSVKASVILRHLSRVDGAGRIPNEDVEGFLSDLLGDRIYQQLLDDGLPYSSLEKLLRWALEEYGIVPKGAQEGVDSPNVG